MKLNILTAAVMTSGLAFFATSANAGVTTDSHGNVGYDTYDECVSAVKLGQAKFYTPYTYQKPKRWKGEASVKKMKLSDVTIPANVAANMPLKTREYSAGACDVGVGQSNGRYGVSGELVGKYVPFSPDMPVNVYMNSAGQPVRMTMQQCDNHFGSRFPTPVISEVKALPAQLEIDENRQMEVVTTEVSRTVRPSNYAVKEVVVAPADQVRYIKTENGTQIAVVDDQGRSTVVGTAVNKEVLDEAEAADDVPVIVVPESE